LRNARKSTGQWEKKGNKLLKRRKQEILRKEGTILLFLKANYTCFQLCLYGQNVVTKTQTSSSAPLIDFCLVKSFLISYLLTKEN
jgi:hypothetical protein